MSHERISPMAMLCARTRALYTEIPYAKEIDDYMRSLDGRIDYKPGAIDVLSQLVERFGKNYPNLLFMAPLFEGRYLSTSSGIAEYPGCTVVELASGLTPRGLERSDLEIPELTIEVDLPYMTALKEKTVAEVKRDNSVLFYAGSALDYQTLRTVGEYHRAHNDGAPLVVVHEGFFMYLSRREQATLRDHIYSFLSEYSPHGAWITPDISIKNQKRVPRGLVAARWIAEKLIRSRTGRSLSYFKNEAEAREFVQEGGLRMRPVEDIDVRSLVSLKRTRMRSGLIRKVRGMFRAYVMTLK